MRRLVVVALLVLAAGCTETPSPIDSKAKVGITSRVTADGAPVDGSQVTLQSGGSFSDLLLFVPGINLVCLGGACRTTDQGVVTHADGRLDLQTTGAATQTLTGGARTLALTASDPTLPPGALGRGAVGHSFKVLSVKVALPDLTLWRSSLTLTRGRVTYQPPPVRSASVTLYLHDAQGNSLGSARGTATTASYDPRLLEDLVARVFAVASTESKGVETDWRSPTYAVKGALRPPSRGAACRAAGGPLVRPCGLTDGDLATPGPRPVLDCSQQVEGMDGGCDERRRQTVIDLGTVRRLSLVVVRGVVRPPSLASSADGIHWVPVSPPRFDPSAGAASRASYAVPVAATARYLRLSSDEPLTEVSAW